VIVGLTGGLACGKSFVAAALRELGAHVVEADELGRAVLAPGGEAVEPVIALFSADIAPGGVIDRRLLAARVFGDPAALAKLNAIVHPAVRARALQEFAGLQARDPHAIIIYVAAILFESGAVHETSKVIVVTCTREQQIERALERPGATPADVEARLARQMPLEEKKALADYVIDAGSTKEQTLRQTKMVFEELKRLSI
jgi:dephospho-CoA kinase